MTELEIFKMKKIWRGNEIPIADYLMSYQEALRAEFMGKHTTVEDAVNAYAVDNLDLRMYGLTIEESTGMQGILSKNTDSGNFEFNMSGWKGVHFKYSRHDEFIDVDLERKDSERISKRYPVAYGLMKEFGEKCCIANYSILAPQTILNRHTGPENRDGKYIRIHIPLIIPEGDVFLEASGEEVTWDDIWGFNNQHAHSAYNYTDEWRVIFMIDLDMAHIGMTPCAPFDPIIDLSGKPFIRGQFN